MLTDGEESKRAIVGAFSEGLRGGNGAKHLNLDNSPTKQLASALLADLASLDICFHSCHSPLHKADASSGAGGPERLRCKPARLGAPWCVCALLKVPDKSPSCRRSRILFADLSQARYLH